MLTFTYDTRGTSAWTSENKIEKITFSLKIFKFVDQTIEYNILLGLIGKLNKVG